MGLINFLLTVQTFGLPQRDSGKPSGDSGGERKDGWRNEMKIHLKLVVTATLSTSLGSTQEEQQSDLETCKV